MTTAIELALTDNIRSITSIVTSFLPVVIIFCLPESGLSGILRC